MDTSTSGDARRIDDILKKIERTKQARRHKFYLRDEKITLSHGSGGKSTHNLIEGVIAPAFSNPLLDPMDDAATFAINGTGSRIAFTTDSYVVSPLFFPGGDIGKLAVHGTINDLSMSGATPPLSFGWIYPGRRLSHRRPALHRLVHGESSIGGGRFHCDRRYQSRPARQSRRHVYQYGWRRDHTR